MVINEFSRKNPRPNPNLSNFLIFSVHAFDRHYVILTIISVYRNCECTHLCKVIKCMFMPENSKVNKKLNCTSNF